MLKISALLANLSTSQYWESAKKRFFSKLRRHPVQLVLIKNPKVLKMSSLLNHQKETLENDWFSAPWIRVEEEVVERVLCAPQSGDRKLVILWTLRLLNDDDSGSEAEFQGELAEQHSRAWGADSDLASVPKAELDHHRHTRLLAKLPTHSSSLPTCVSSLLKLLQETSEHTPCSSSGSTHSVQRRRKAKLSLRQSILFPSSL